MYKIAHLSTMTRLGGIEVMLKDFLLAKPEPNFEHHLITTSSSIDVLKEIKSGHIPHFEPRRMYRKDPTGLLQIVKYLKAHQIEVMHCYNSNANIVGYLCRLLHPRLKIITGEHGSVWNNQGTKKWFDRKANRAAEYIVANSKASKKALVTQYNLNPEKIHVIYNPIPWFEPLSKTLARKELKIEEREFVIGSVGRIVNQKGFHVLLHTFKNIVSQIPECRLLIIGSGEMEQLLRQLSIELQIEDKVTFAGEKANARRLLSAFDVFVNTSLRESFGNVLLEANMACVPLIAPLTCGIPEAVVDGETGLLIKPEKLAVAPFNTGEVDVTSTEKLPLRLISHIQLSQKIVELYNNKGLRSTLTQNGYKRVTTEFTLSNYCRSISSLYLKTVNSNA
ncbi:glycosyltransferase [bacterium]|nr:glycosyltransferase [bacterium]